MARRTRDGPPEDVISRGVFRGPDRLALVVPGRYGRTANTNNADPRKGHLHPKIQKGK